MRRRLPLLLTAGVLLVVAVAFLGWCGGALYRRWVTFPARDAAWRAHRSLRQPVAETGGWREFRGIIHAHTALSHDSRMSPEEVVAAVKAAGLDFVCLTDHPRVDGRAAFDTQWRGLHRGVLVVPGFELRDGILALGAASDVVLNNRASGADLIDQVTRRGGLAFYAHPETPRDWRPAAVSGLEIYNLHTDFKRQGGSVGAAVRARLADLWLSFERYPDQVRYLPFQRPTEFLRLWDDLNRTRAVTGVAGNDSHQNVGLRAWITPTGRLRIDDTSPKPMQEHALDGMLGTVLRWWYGPLTPGRELFRLQLDPYEASARFVNTHVLAQELTEEALKASLLAGRVQVGFDGLADSSGFRWLARAGSVVRVMGESLPFSPAIELCAVSPIPCRFTLVRNGEVVGRQEGRGASWRPDAPGKYRVEAELRVEGAWIPWVYANPIELSAPTERAD